MSSLDQELAHLADTFSGDPAETYLLLAKREDLAKRIRRLSRRKTRPGPKKPRKKKKDTGEGSK